MAAKFIVLVLIGMFAINNADAIDIPTLPLPGVPELPVPDLPIPALPVPELPIPSLPSLPALPSLPLVLDITATCDGICTKLSCSPIKLPSLLSILDPVLGLLGGITGTAISSVSCAQACVLKVSALKICDLVAIATYLLKICPDTDAASACLQASLLCTGVTDVSIKACTNQLLALPLPN